MNDKDIERLALEIERLPELLATLAKMVDASKGAPNDRKVLEAMFNGFAAGLRVRGHSEQALAKAMIEVGVARLTDATSIEQTMQALRLHAEMLAPTAGQKGN